MFDTLSVPKLVPNLIFNQAVEVLKLKVAEVYFGLKSTFGNSDFVLTALPNRSSLERPFPIRMLLCLFCNLTILVTLYCISLCA